MVAKPILLGMNNPHSDDPTNALAPWPVGCSGHRLLCMMQEVRADFSINDYVEAFDRRNLITSAEAYPSLKREQRRMFRQGAKAFRHAMAQERQEGGERSVVVLGRDTWEALYNSLSSLRGVQVMESRRVIGVRWHRVPHPSGRSLWYNDEANRRAVGELLLRLAGRET